MTKPQWQIVGGLNGTSILNGDSSITGDAKSASNGKMAFGINVSNHCKVINSFELESSIMCVTLAEELIQQVTKTRQIDDTKIVIK